MKLKVNKSLVFATVLSLLAPIQFVFAEDKILVEGKHLLCVKEHIDTYKSERKNPLLIILPECPNPLITAEIIEKYAKGVDLGECLDCSSEDIQEIISLRPEELACLEATTEIDPEIIYDISQLPSICR